MDEDAPHQMRWPRVAARVIGYAVFAVVFYVLSVGPVAWLLWRRSPTIDGGINAIYMPLALAAKITGMLQTLEAYHTWWVSLPGGPTERMLRQSPPLPASQVPGPAAPLP